MRLEDRRCPSTSLCIVEKCESYRYRTKMRRECAKHGKERRVFEFPDVKFPNASHGCHYTHKGETLFKHTSYALGYSLNYESIKSVPRRQTHTYIEHSHIIASHNFTWSSRDDYLHVFYIFTTFMYSCSIQNECKL